MSLSELANLGEFLSSIAVLASLIYVGVQLRQNTRAQRAAAQETYQAQKFAHISLLIADGEVAEIHRKGLQGLSYLDDTERWRFGALMQQLFDMGLTMQRNRDAFEKDMLSTEPAIYSMSRPGAVEWWQHGRVLYPKFYQDVVDGWIAEAQARHDTRKAAKTGE